MAKKTDETQNIAEESSGIYQQEEQPTDNGALEAVPDIKTRIKCKIRNQQGEDGKMPVFVRVLGTSAYEAYIPRETDVEIPDYVYDYLRSLEGYEVVPETVNGKVVMTEKPFKRYIIEKSEDTAI